MSEKEKIKMNKKQTPKTNDVYQSYLGAGKLYRVLEVARDARNPEQARIVYEQLFESEFPKGEVFSRTLEDFVGYETIKGRKVKRFTLID